VRSKGHARRTLPISSADSHAVSPPSCQRCTRLAHSYRSARATPNFQRDRALLCSARVLNALGWSCVHYSLSRVVRRTNLRSLVTHTRNDPGADAAEPSRVGAIALGSPYLRTHQKLPRLQAAQAVRTGGHHCARFIAVSIDSAGATLERTQIVVAYSKVTAAGAGVAIAPVKIGLAGRVTNLDPVIARRAARRIGGAFVRRSAPVIIEAAVAGGRALPLPLAWYARCHLSEAFVGGTVADWLRAIACYLAGAVLHRGTLNAASSIAAARPAG
jgi:hypothetical protein